MDEKHKIRIGITLGDINGISPELIIKAMSDERLFKYATFIIYGSEVALKYHHKLLPDYKVVFNLLTGDTKISQTKPNLIEIGGPQTIVTMGQANETAGRLAMSFLNAALSDLKSNKIDALITGPLNKSTIKMENEPFKGHTEYIARYFNVAESMMFMVYENLRVGLVTNHLPLEEVSKNLSAALILNKLKIMQKTLSADFAIHRPKIAVLGLNPHAGDNGLLGKEEKEIIIPAIQKATDQGILAYGPYPADGFFGNGLYKNFDAVLAMYHDQGLIPFKSISGSEGVNYTAGLPIIRTSPDHGTAYDIAGKNQAHINSILNCIFYTKDIINNRNHFTEDTANPMKRNASKDRE